MRSPRFSKRSLIAPVRLRRVASGLMIDSVRSMVIFARLRLSLPARRRLVPIGQLVTGFAGAPPAPARGLHCTAVVAIEQIDAAREGPKIRGLHTINEHQQRSPIGVLV